MIRLTNFNLIKIGSDFKFARKNQAFSNKDAARYQLAAARSSSPACFYGLKYCVAAIEL
jgi:hypothetical protein